MPTKKELQEKFCEGCPTQQPSYEGVSPIHGGPCPCPKGQDDWERCNWKSVFQESGIWAQV